MTENLIHRGDELILHTKQILKDVRNHSLDHLVDTIEHDLGFVEVLYIVLKSASGQLKNYWKLTKFKSIDLLTRHFNARPLFLNLNVNMQKKTTP